jgi:hypothetical protein
MYLINRYDNHKSEANGSCPAYFPYLCEIKRRRGKKVKGGKEGEGKKVKGGKEGEGRKGRCREEGEGRKGR